MQLSCRVSLIVAILLVACSPGPAQTLPYPAISAPEPLPFSLPIQATPNAAYQHLPIAPPAAPPEQIEIGEPLAEQIATPPPAWYQFDYWIKSEWDSGVELGINGSSGTSESISVRAGGYVKHEDEARKVAFDIYHNRTSASGVETQNNARSNLRHDWLFGDSPWTVYLMSQLYHDEFQAFDLNANTNTGIGYRFVNEEWMELTGSLGSGVSRKIGGPNDDWIPEAQFGMEYEQKISARQKLTAKVDYFPEWGQFSNFRMISDLGWQVQLDVPSNVSLKLAATDRYDGQPDGAPPHNLNYSLLLLWKL